MVKRKKKKISSLKKEKSSGLDRGVTRGAWSVVLFALATLSVLSFFEAAGSLGRIFSNFLELAFGWGMYIAPLVLAFVAVSFVIAFKRERGRSIIISAVLFFSAILAFLALVGGDAKEAGGYWGFIIQEPLRSILGTAGTAVILLAIVGIAVILGFNVSLGKIFDSMREKRRTMKDALELDEGKVEKSLPLQTELQDKPKFEVRTFQDAAKNETKRSKDGKDEKKGDEMGLSRAASATFANFQLPPADLLERDTGKPTSGDIVANANIIRRTFQNFGIDVEMGEVNVGPTVTQYTMKPAEGIKLSRLTALSNDLSLALAAHPLRIEAPIPGRSLVGIELPNRTVAWVRLRDLVSNEQFVNSDANLQLTLGRDVSGAPVYASLARMPHMLIAGSTGSGKTIALNTIILSLLYKNPPQLLRFILIDPKRVEFSVYEGIPHLLSPVIVDNSKAVNALKWAVNEMERRFEVLSIAKARDIEGYNLNKRNIEQDGPMPYIVIVIDELADLMSSKGREVEALIVRVAQMARAVGIHLVLATQRPSVEVITGLIKANITVRAAFQVASQVDSRTILDMAGAEKLLGRGDMLFLSPERSKPRRIQGVYVNDSEVKKVAEFLRKQKEAFEQGAMENFDTARRSTASIDFDETGDGGVDDELYEEARDIVIKSRKASASLLQRRLRIGYARAARILDVLEENGVVGPVDGAKPRDVYIGDDDVDMASEEIEDNDNGG